MSYLTENKSRILALEDQDDIELALAAVQAELAEKRQWKPLAYQVPPEGEWRIWLFMGGRGVGKTDTISNYVKKHLEGPACDSRLPGGHRIGIIAPTLGDAIESMGTGPTGIRAHMPESRMVTGVGGTHIRFPGGAEAKLFGAYTPEDVERLRAGGNRCLAVCEELAAWRFLDECWAHMRYGLRIGAKPKIVIATTPKPKKLIKALVKRDDVVHTHATTDMNPYLSQTVRDELYESYGGTRIGRQELYGELLEDVEGALWASPMIEQHRILTDEVGDLWKIVVGVDPAVTNTEDSDETGIVVCGLDSRGHVYVLFDRSIKASPDTWATEALRAFDDAEADLIIGEVNNGGDLVESVLRGKRPNVSYKAVRASRGKAVRAEPIVGMYERGEVHHVGYHAKLEEQMLNWVPGEGKSPDRVDALVWAITELKPPTPPRRQLHYEAP